MAEMGEDVVALGFPLGQNSLKISKGGRLMMVAVVYCGVSLISTILLEVGCFALRYQRTATLIDLHKIREFSHTRFPKELFLGQCLLAPICPAHFFWIECAIHNWQFFLAGI